MYCPKPECPDTQANGFQAEYRNEVTVCPFCGSGLVATPEPVDAPERPQPKGADDEVFEVVFETGDATEAAIIKSLLEGAEIPYLTRGEDQSDAFRGVFRSMLFNPSGRPIVFTVPARLAGEARQLLEETELPDEDA